MTTQRIIDSFVEMAGIYSPTYHEAFMARYLENKLTELGFAVYVDDTAHLTGSDTGNVIGRLAGTAPGHVSFSAHMDTVEPCDGIECVITNREVEGEECEVIASAGDTILSADDKAGLAAIIEGITRAIESGIPRPDITVVFTTGEEKGLLGASALSADAFAWPGSEGGEGKRHPFACFVLDAGGHPGTIVAASPAHYLMNATFKGRAAHAGAAPEEGISAIEMAACAIAAMPLGRIDEKTTANIGTIEGGSAMNVVAAQCSIVGECRSHDDAALEAQRSAMDSACREAAKRFGGELDITWKLEYPRTVLAEGGVTELKLRRAIEAAGMSASLQVTGGGSDANVLGALGVDAVAVGIGMAEYHTCDEYIKVADLEGSARLVEAIIAEYAVL